MEEGKSVGINLIWAITFLVVVVFAGGAIYYSGALNPVQEKKVDVEVKVPDLPKSN